MAVHLPSGVDRVAGSLLPAAVAWEGDIAAGATPALDLIGEASLVLIGEASHGTRQFYRERAEITKRLIERGRCHAVAVEADWPDAYRVNRYVQLRGADRSASDALADFQRFPSWMWRNEEVRAFVEWLRTFNAARAPEDRVGFYGLDLYSLYSSMAAVISHLEAVDPEAAHAARQRYACFEDYDEDPQSYGLAASTGPECEQQAVEQLVALRAQAGELLQRDGLVAEDEQFCAEQNARLVKNAERYYRGTFSDRINTWNLRDRHMAEMLAALREHLRRRRPGARLAVWAHNSHLGDARATEMSGRGELNLGQLVREHYGAEAFNLGFTTWSGTVAAASDWGEPVERKRVRPALPNSYEEVMHHTGLAAFLLDLRDPRVRDALRQPRLERAIGVIYRPYTERHSHYFFAELADQFDALLHLDHTDALDPLERSASWSETEPAPDTYPFGV